MNRRHATAIGAWLGERDHSILLSLHRFRLLSTRHVQHLHFADRAGDLAAARAAARALRKLHELGLIASLSRRIGGARKGSASYIWQLTSTGERFVRTLSGQQHRRRYVEPGVAFVDHTLAVNDIAVGLLVADRLSDMFSVDELTTEPANWRSYVGPGGETQWLKPDLHVISTVIDPAEPDAAYETHQYLEIDRGTEHRPQIEAKCRRYAAYAQSGAYQAAHGLFPAVVWLSPNKARRAALRAAVAAVTGLPEGVFAVTSPDAFLAQASGSQ